jgi:hypothetical protein
VGSAIRRDAHLTTSSKDALVASFVYLDFEKSNRPWPRGAKDSKPPVS